MPPTDEDAEELAFRRLYGDWRALDPAASFMAGFPGEWWIVGRCSDRRTNAKSCTATT